MRSLHQINRSNTEARKQGYLPTHSDGGNETPNRQIDESTHDVYVNPRTEAKVGIRKGA